MKRLECEMCGSTDVVKQDGLFVCQVCGCKYSLEEARKMMVEGTVEVTGTVRVDHSGTIENYRTLLDSALDSGNNEQAELYCNKIIEIDPSNWYAWLRKGHAAGWQSSLSNLRISEAITCYGSSLNCADEEVKETIIDYSKQDMQDMCLACVNLQLERFAKWPDEEETNGVLQIVAVVYQSMTNYISTMRVSIDPEELMQPIAANITSTVINTWNNYISREYINDDDTGHPGKYAFTKLLDRAGYCRILLLKAIELSKNDDDSDISRYESLIAMNNYCMNNCAWDYNYSTDYILGIPYTTKNWYQASSLSQEAVNLRRRNNAEYQNKITAIRNKIAAKEAAEKREKERIEQEKKNARVAAYWEEHPTEKQALEQEKSALGNIVAEMTKQMMEIPKSPDVMALQDQLDTLQNDKAQLSLFSLKERMNVQKKIDAISEQLVALKNEKEAGFKARKTVAERRLQEIHQELNKDRP